MRLRAGGRAAPDHLAAERARMAREALSISADCAAAHALELDPDLAEGYTSLACALQYYDWDWPRADEAYRRAITLFRRPEDKARAEQGLRELRAAAPDSLRAIFEADSVQALRDAARESTSPR